ncbi:MAG: hypothetical protein Q4D62_14885 [Planctomycetia bacterium]|nr:hypothetical protein [Planctomycetia bacterium]
MFLDYDGRFFGDVAEFIAYRDKETGEEARKLIVLRGEEFVVFDVLPGKLGASLGARVVPTEAVEEVKKAVEEFKKTQE